MTKVRQAKRPSQHRRRAVVIDLKALQRRLKWALKLGGITANALSVILGLSRNSVGNLEEGAVFDPGINLVERIAVGLGVSLDWLVRGHGAEPTAELVREAVARARVAEPPKPLRRRRAPRPAPVEQAA